MLSVFLFQIEREKKEGGDEEEQQEEEEEGGKKEPTTKKVDKIILRQFIPVSFTTLTPEVSSHHSQYLPFISRLSYSSFRLLPLITILNLKKESSTFQLKYRRKKQKSVLMKKVKKKKWNRKRNRKAQSNLTSLKHFIPINISS